MQAVVNILSVYVEVAAEEGNAAVLLQLSWAWMGWVLSEDFPVFFCALWTSSDDDCYCTDAHAEELDTARC